MIIDLLKEDGYKIKTKVPNKEYSSPCPLCNDGDDRFIIWSETGRWWCRRCGRNGDEIQYLKEVRGMTFKEACRYLNIDSKYKVKSVQKNVNNTHVLQKQSKKPQKLWQSKALAFVDWSHQNLMGNKTQLEWLLGKRGLTLETIKAARLGWNPKDIYKDREDWGLHPKKNKKGNISKLHIPLGLVIPVFLQGELDRIKTRYDSRKPKYLPIAEGGVSPMVLLEQCNFGVIMVLESELDALLVHQECGDLITVVAMGSASYKPDNNTHEMLKKSTLILQSYDTDTTGVEVAWKWWREKYTQWKRWPCIQGKDPMESMLNGINIRKWVQVGLQGILPEEAFGFFDFLHENETPSPDELFSLNEVTIGSLATKTSDSNMCKNQDKNIIQVNHGQPWSQHAKR